MAWSPDQEILMLITRADTLLCMSQDFDILREQPLHVEGFGEQAPVTVGWGKAETQFRGSAGKMAASPAGAAGAGGASSGGGGSALAPGDDLRARLSWRGDGQFVATLVVSGRAAGEQTGASVRQQRTLRVWSREGALQSTAQDAGQLSHALAWRPDGSLIAGVQLAGGVGGARAGASTGTGDGASSEARTATAPSALAAAAGRKWEVVFFERNGLRHGEFTLPYAADTCVVRELEWNSDSSVLVVWLAAADGAWSKLQFWTTSNFHWCVCVLISTRSYLP